MIHKKIFRKMKRRAFLEEPENRPTKRRTQPTLTPAQSMAVTREVNRQLARKADYKQCDFDIVPTAVSTAGGTWNLFNNMGKGDLTVNTYEGTSTQVKSIRVRGQFTRADTTQALRLVIVQQFDNTAPTPGYYFPSAGTIIAPYSRRNWVVKSQFKILKDMLINLDAASADSMVFDIYIPGFKVRKQWWNDTTANVPTSGGLYLVALSDSSAIGHPSLVFASEIVFTD